MKSHYLETLAKQYLREKDITKKTFELYNMILNQYISYLKEHQIIYARNDDLIDYIDSIKSKGYSRNWIYLQIGTIKGFYQYLSYNQKRLNLSEEYAFDISQSIKNVSKKVHVKKQILTVEQAKHLIVHSRDNRNYIWHYRDYAIIYLMLTTGLRSIEIRRAKIKDLQYINNKLVLYIQGKGRTSTDEFVKITKGVKIAITDYLNKRNDKIPYLFISHSIHSKTYYLSQTFFHQMLKRVLKDANLDSLGITPHSLRHTAATLNLLRGGSLESTKQFMRHSNMSTTLIYAHHINVAEDDSGNEIEKYILGSED